MSLIEISSQQLVMPEIRGKVMSNIGFVLLTHGHPEQALRLMNTLNKVYNFPPIAWHHDFSKSEFPVNRCTSNVEFVNPHVKTSWGTYSLVEAKLKALKLLYRSETPSFYSTLSGADYPIKQAHTVLKDLETANCDVHIRHALIDYQHLYKTWHHQYYKRYCSINLLFKRTNKKGFKVVSQLPLIKHPALTQYFTPFNKKIKCWGGEFWYTGSKKSAQFILEHVAEDPYGLVKHYRKVKIPDESLFQTIFKNSDSLICSNDSKRYIDWSAGQPHPKTLTLDDYTKILESNAHFARKFDTSESSICLLDKVDSLILGI